MSKSLKDIGVVSLLTVVSRVLGLLRDSIQLAIFGAGWVMSAFTTANIAPNLFRRLLAEGSMTAAFVPALQEELHANGKEGTFRLLSKVVSWLLVITGALVLLAMAVFSQSRLFLPSHEDKWYVAADLTVILFPYLALISLSAAFSATLNVLQRFFEPALSPIWLNLSIIAALGGAGLYVARSPIGAIHWLCAGWLLGGFFQMAVPATVLIVEGWRPRFDLGLSPRVREIAHLMTPGILGTAIYQINFSVSRLLAFSIDDASATYLYAINRLMEFPIGVFAVAVSTVIYPLIAGHAVKRDFAAMAGDFQKGIRLILVINIPAAAGLALLSGPIVRLIFRHGQVTQVAAHEMGLLLAIMAIGLPFFSVVNLMVRAFYAVKDTKTPVRVAMADFVINIAVSLVLIRFLGVVGIVMASTTAIIAQAVLLERALVRRLPRMHFAPLLPSIGKVALSAAVMAGVVAGGWRGLQGLGLGGRATDAIAIAGLIPAGAVTYGLVLWRLRIEGRQEIGAILVRVPLLGRLFRSAL
ncbi:MAG TPA: murein biosynthesis integral membrane protein MurJ [Opitutaceae bacterium]|nr:murein biosynthesis integral membrane protein MurJ [Opitutaceae bacterium]